MKFPSYGAAGVLTVCLLSAPAFASASGQTLQSGKQGSTCNSCHFGGTAPTVEISGPMSLEAGKTGTYAFIIHTAAAKGGFNVAVDSSAASLTAGTGSKKMGAELTHSAPKASSSGEVRFDFTMTAPSSAGTVKIFGAGNAVNVDSNTTGDASAATTLSVAITGGATPTPEPETGNEDEGGCSATGGTPLALFSLLAGGLTLMRRRRD